MSQTRVLDENVDPRIIRTLNLLSQAFTEVVSKKGFRNVTVQDITETAGVNRTTFYLHFPDKFALLDYNVGQLFRLELEKRMLNLCHYTPQNLHSLIVSVAEFIMFSNSNCKSSDPQFEALVEMQVKKQVQELIQTWGEVTTFQVEARTASIAVSWAIYGLAQDWSHDKNRSTAESLASDIHPMITALLGVES
jgi:AcrR family transcriptional regulator